MTSSLLMAVEFGGYVSIVKLVLFLVCYFPWLLLVGWANKDAKAVSTNVPLWIGILLGAGFLAILIWWLIPLFIVGLLAFAIVAGGTAIAYVRHRNTRVLDFDKVLTVSHIKSLLSRSGEPNPMENFQFITTNNNEVPSPEPRTPMFFG